MVDNEPPEDEDMSQQVLIRSPVTHHHHYEHEAEPKGPQTEQPAKSDWLRNAAIAAALLAGGGGLGLGIAAMLQPQPQVQQTPDFTDTDTIAVPQAVQIYGTDLE